MNEPSAATLLADPALKRADLHCHSRFSIFKYFRRANTRDCYNNPEDVYRIAKERGMSYVTLTDHDSTAGWDEAREAANRGGWGCAGRG